MSREIIININELNKTQKYNTNALLQLDAFEKITNILKNHNGGKDNNDIVDCRIHDTIFVDGHRGAGKTAFMLNIENYYNKQIEKSNKKEKNYTFFNSIDPTLLEHTEKFLSVVLARIVEKSNKYIQNNNINNERLNKYYESLEELSKSLSAIKTLPEDLGIEEIASNKSSLKLEQHSHEFFIAVTKLFDSKGLVILIDDVDMAFDKGFDVLEVVRKYLASPYIIPIVAGDVKLYKTIIETEFKKKIYNENNDSKKDENFINELVEQYLRKVFPNDKHIQLKSIFKILKEDVLIFEMQGEKEKFKISYNDIKDFEIRHINLGINQVEFTYQIFSNNTRDLFQYISNKKEIYTEFFENIDRNKLEITTDIEYNPNEVSSKFDEDISNIILNKKIYKESLKITGEFYSSSYNRKKKDLSNLTLNDYSSSKNTKYSLYSIFCSNYFQEIEKLKLDTANNNYALQGKKLNSLRDNNEDKYNDLSNYIIELFVFNDYYSSYQTRSYIYAGKFIENMIFSLDKNTIEDDMFNKNWILDIHSIINKKVKKADKSLFNEFTDLFNLNVEIYSLVYDNNSIKEENTQLLNDINQFKKNITLDNIEDTLSSIAYKVPFGSDFSKNKARYKEEDTNDDIEEFSTLEKFNLEYYSKNLILWQNIFLNDVQLNSISLYEILLKFFRNLEKIKGMKFENDKPIDFIRRIVLAFINAIAYFENSNKNISNTNFAMSENFVLESILSKTPASFKNIYPMFKEEFSLTRALFFHPLISHILFTDEKNIEVKGSFNSKLLILEWQGREVFQKQNKEETISKSNKVSIYSFHKIYIKYFYETKLKPEFESKKLETYKIYLDEMIRKLKLASHEALLKLRKNKYEKVYRMILSLSKEDTLLMELLIKYQRLVYINNAKK